MIFNMVGGGGGSSTKSTIIVSIDTGSTVAAYSDSSYTTLVKTASEKSTGEFWLTGLNNGTYYLKATKGSDEATTSYTISQYGVYRITMTYFQATITVTFPTSASAVSLSDGVTTLNVPSGSLSSGSYVFAVGNTGTWVANATANGYPMSEQITITTDGQSETIAVKYRIYSRGEMETATSGGLSNDNYTYSGNTAKAPTFNANDIYYNNTSGVTGVGTVNIIDFSGFNAIKAIVMPTTTAVHPWLAAVSSKTFSTPLARVEPTTLNVENTLSIPLSGLGSSSGYIGVFVSTGNAKGYLYDLWME